MPERWRGRGKEDRMQGAWRMKSAMRSNSERFLAPLPRVSFYSRLVGFTSKMCKLLNDKSQGLLMFTVTLMFSERNKKAFASDFGTRKLCAAVAVFFPVNQGAL